jgi:hypothetical protein
MARSCGHRRRVLTRKAQESHERQAIVDQEFRALVGEIVRRLKDKKKDTALLGDSESVQWLHWDYKTFLA